MDTRYLHWHACPGIVWSFTDSPPRVRRGSTSGVSTTQPPTLLRFVSSRLALGALALTLGLTACDSGGDYEMLTPEADVPTAENGAVIPGRYIVVMTEAQGKTSARSALADVLGTLTANKSAAALDLDVYENTVVGFAADLDAETVSRLQGDSRIDYIEPDRIMVLKKPGGTPGGGGGGGSQSQSTPYGITRVNGGGSNVSASLRACVIDSGIDLDHEDLNVDLNASQSFLSGNQSNNPDDQNGHGTHVAGTIAAINNSVGVIGVAPGATVVSVRVLDRRGSGSYSGVIAGVDYVGSGAPDCDVANMSLGGPVSQALDSAVQAAAQSGVKFALAAGNESQHASNSSPARANGNNIYTVSAINSSDVFASFSNYGNPPVDVAAPGVAVESTYKGGGYSTLSGTSMASPHVAGILLLGNLSTNGNAINDPDGNADPIAVH